MMAPPWLVRVATYNVLAPKWIGNHTKYCPAKYASWQYRWPLIQQQVEALDPDVLLCQVGRAHRCGGQGAWCAWRQAKLLAGERGQDRKSRSTEMLKWQQLMLQGRRSELSAALNPSVRTAERQCTHRAAAAPHTLHTHTGGGGEHIQPAAAALDGAAGLLFNASVEEVGRGGAVGDSRSRGSGRRALGQRAVGQRALGNGQWATGKGKGKGEGSRQRGASPAACAHTTSRVGAAR